MNPTPCWNFETETETRDCKICALCWNFSKNYHHYFKVEFFQISGIFPICFGCFLLTNTTEKNSLNYRSFTKPYPCNIDSFKPQGLWPRPVTFESKMRPETFKTETETRKKGLETKYQDSITANNPTKLSNQKSC